MTETHAPGHDRPLTVGVCTRDRQASLLRCLRSLRHVEGMVERVFVADDASAQPVEPVIRAELGDDAARVTVLRAETGIGPTAGRNRISREAATPFILYLDDDAALLSRDSIRAGLDVLRADASVAAVAFAQADADG
ncbi:MAG TPA: glycosyltransferase, partial [Longimicrobium sp.]|nr:glycosyltransferase [Longimicrobium sp.]